MFKNDDSRKKISEHLPNAFEKMQELRNMEDLEIFKKELANGLSFKFAINLPLMEELKKTKDYDIEFDESIKFPDIINSVFDEIRYDEIKYQKSSDFLYDKISKQRISKLQITKIIFGLEKYLNSSIENYKLNDNLTYNEVLKYVSDNETESISKEPINFEEINVNQLVKIAKIRLENKKIKEDIEKFKNDLLDEYLNYVLEKEYSYISKENYSKAKKEQILKEKKENVEMIKNQLYDIFINGNDNHFHQEIILKIKNIPKTFTTIDYKSRYSSNLQKIKIEKDSEFLPEHISPFRVNGKQFKTVYHYVYSKLISNLLEISSFIELEKYNINDADVDKLDDIYNQIKNDWSDFAISKLFELAVKRKFDYHFPILFTLLETKSYEIVYSSIDPILGTGPDGKGKNKYGGYLVYLREFTDFSKIYKNSNYRILDTVRNNAVLKVWFFSWALELRNTMLMLNKPNTADLKKIYKKDFIEINRKPSIDELAIFEAAGLTKIQIDACFPIILSEFEKIKEMTLSEFSKMQVETYIEELAIDIYSKQFLEKIQSAIFNLKEISNSIQLGPNLTSLMFVQSLLSRKHVYDNKIYLPRESQVKRWSSI
jgi:predicted NAD-dependent protein-ADP-ribosyltransferase YbiA (DUF1768 family)